MSDDENPTTYGESDVAVIPPPSTPPPIATTEDNPRDDPGPVRLEDTWPQDLGEGVEPVELTSPEVPLEDSVRDHTTVLATDVFDNEGHIINREVPPAPEQ